MASEQMQKVATEVQTVLTDQLQNGTSATLNNHTVTNMQLIKSHSWSGNFNTQPPKTITSHGGVARFVHLKGVKGSKAGVMYTITGAVVIPEAPYAVVLAWDAPSNFSPMSPNRLYGKCGPKSVIEKLPWEAIEKELEKAGPSVVINDEVAKISVHANLTNNPKTKMADLWANFLVIPPTPNNP
ncbi:hypothetical protein RND81_10G223200 [Saponaria officinalis]|uniref:Uncharacterized protein n=1 Tax=Saponaria officinalis TaxID=3572 RepID=A0AAW1I630_SAPOF